MAGMLYVPIENAENDLTGAFWDTTAVSSGTFGPTWVEDQQYYPYRVGGALAAITPNPAVSVSLERIGTDFFTSVGAFTTPTFTVNCTTLGLVSGNKIIITHHGTETATACTVNGNAAGNGTTPGTPLATRDGGTGYSSTSAWVYELQAGDILTNLAIAFTLPLSGSNNVMTITRANGATSFTSGITGKDGVSGNLTATLANASINTARMGLYQCAADFTAQSVTWSSNVTKIEDEAVASGATRHFSLAIGNAAGSETITATLSGAVISAMVIVGIS